MTRERAQYIIANQLFGGELRYAFRMRCDGPSKTVYSDGITYAEDRFIREVWKTMPGHTCYFDALRRIARGKLDPVGVVEDENHVA